MINSNFEFISSLQYKVKSLAARVKAFESGEKYNSMYSEFKNQISVKEREIRKLKNELADAHAQTVTVRKQWAEVFEDLGKGHAKEIAEKDRGRVFKAV